MTLSEPEIIDLTTTPPPPDIITILSDEDHASTSNHVQSETNAESSRRLKKARKRKRTGAGDVEDGEIVESSAQVSREGSRNGIRNSRDVATGPKNGIEPERKREKVGTKRHHRSASADAEANPSSRRRSRSKDRDKLAALDDSNIFFVDLKPVPIPVPIIQSETATEQNKSKTLLLPEHVSVFGSDAAGIGPIEILPPSEPDSDEEEYINFLDYDDYKAHGVVRYFDGEEEEAKPSKPVKIVCKNCGAEDEHRTYECPVQICLTCGVRDEHATRSCPISKTCYSCGMRGHINSNCPNRFSRTGDFGNYDDCDRCGAGIHKTNECPTLWRLYEYLTDDDRAATLKRKEDRASILTSGTGAWCYNCGEFGHWGDDCDYVPHPYDFPNEPSAFSIHNTMSGPFYDPATEPAQSTSHQKKRRPEEEEYTLPDGWGKDAPVNVGKEAKSKNKAKLEKRMKEQEDADEDVDDWFGRSREKPRGTPTSNGRGGNHRAPPSGSKKMVIGLRKEGKQFQPPTAPSNDRSQGRPSLLDRLEDAPADGPSRQSGRAGGPSKRSEDRRRDRDRNHRDKGPPSKDRRDRRDQVPAPGPRYKGGYSR